VALDLDPMAQNEVGCEGCNDLISAVRFKSYD
jgi:hypothetical protein